MKPDRLLVCRAICDGFVQGRDFWEPLEQFSPVAMKFDHHGQVYVECRESESEKER